MYDYAERVVKPEFDEIMSYIGLRNKYLVLKSLQDPKQIPVKSLFLSPLKSKERTYAKDKSKYDGTHLIHISFITPNMILFKIFLNVINQCAGNECYEDPQGPSVSWVNDIVRCSFSCASLEDIYGWFLPIYLH